MNFEICKRCLTSKRIGLCYDHKYIRGKTLYCVKIVGFPTSQTVCKLQNNHLFETEEKMSEVYKRKSYDDLVVIDEDCPFYIEHMISEGNEK